MTKRRNMHRVRWWVYAIAAVVIFVALAPIVWLAIASITPSDALLEKPLRFFPAQVDLSRWNAIFTQGEHSPAGGFRVSMLNSLVIAFGTVVVSLLVGIPGAYAFSRLRFRGRRTALMTFLATYMVPTIALVIPLYLIMANLHLLNTRIGLIIVYSSFVTPFVLWSLSNYMDGVPRELDEAATIDGAGRLRILWSVLLPLTRPGIFAAILFATLLCWDEFLYALIFTSTTASKTIPVAVAEFSGKFSTDFGLVAAGGVLAALPPVFIALAFQRYLVAGLVSGAVKG